MNDDKDLTYIEGLFGIGVALALVALLAFTDGQSSLALVAIAVAAIGLLGAYYIRRRRQRLMRH